MEYILWTKNSIKETKSSVPQALNSYEAKETLRTHTGFQELDRVLGGGLVKGSLVLLGGEPGIRKINTYTTNLWQNQRWWKSFICISEKNQQNK